MRSFFGLIAFSLMTVYFIWASWQYSVAYRGWFATSVVLAIHTAPLAALWAFYYASRRRPTFWRSLSFHFLWVLWFVTVAFPDVVELP